MKKYLIFLPLLLLNSLYAKYYSLQFATFKTQKEALDYKNRYNKNYFIYKTDSNYYTVRDGVFKSVKEAKQYQKLKKLKNFVIVPIDINKLKLTKKSKKVVNKTNCKTIEKKLTPCMINGCVPNNKTYPWEQNISKFQVNPKVLVITPNETNITTKETNQSKTITNELLRFYIDLYGNYIYGQAPINYNRIKDLKLIAKLGIQYGFDFYDNYHFYTDDRIALSYDNYKKYKTTTSTGIYFDINELYINSFDLNYNRSNFIIGRKKIKDYNSIFYNSPLDLIGLYNAHDLLLYRAYLGTRLNNFKIKDDNDAFGINTKSIRFLILQTKYQYYFEHYLYFLYQYENSYKTSINEKRKGQWFSIRIHNTNFNENGDKLFYYGNIAYLKGKKQLNSNNYNGNEFLLGFMYEPSKWVNKGVGASLAHSSKDYFQPYISNNKSNFISNSLSFKYFGEFLDPELSNINILSLYFKYNKDIKNEYMLALHKYLKTSTNNDIYASRYVLNTNNSSKDVGQELDLLYKYTEGYKYYWQVGAFYFLGGGAFTNTTNKKDGLGAKVNFRYYW
jgi:hypothetical protein